MRVKLSDWAKKNGVSYQTAWNWVKSGKMPNNIIKTDTGTILVEEENVKRKDEKTFIYARVSSNNKKDDLKNQLELCNQFCLSKGWVVHKSLKEIASGMNDNRVKLNEILSNPPSKLVVLHKDRLTRFGFNYLKVLLAQLGCEVIVINESGENEEDILKDFVAIITSFCCRLYGARRGQSKALRMKGELND